MQLLAMLTMLIDHVGLVFFPEQELWRIIGRISFPLYVYALVLGYERTSSRRRYLYRLGAIAMASQVPYQLALNPDGLNVVVSLLAGALVLQVLERTGSFLMSAVIVSTAGILMDLLPFDYGAYGLLLVVIFRYARSHMLVLWHLMLNVLFLFLNGWELQLWSLFPTLVIAYGPWIANRLESARVSPWVWRSFYPLHLAVIAAVQWLK